MNKHVDARAAGSRDLDNVQKAKQALDKRMADLEAQGRKDQDTINDLRKQVAKLQSEKDANDAAAQQRISFLEGQGKKDTEEIAYLKRQVRIPNTQFNSFVLWYPCVNETLNMCVSCCVTSS